MKISCTAAAIWAVFAGSLLVACDNGSAPTAPANTTPIDSPASKIGTWSRYNGTVYSTLQIHSDSTSRLYEYDSAKTGYNRHIYTGIWRGSDTNLVFYWMTDSSSFDGTNWSTQSNMGYVDKGKATVTAQVLELVLHKSRTGSVEQNRYVRGTSGVVPAEVITPPLFSALMGDTYQTDSVMITGVFGSQIYYTLDGSNPTTTSGRYDQPIVVPSNTTVKAIAVKNGTSSSVASTTILIQSSGATSPLVGIWDDHQDGSLSTIQFFANDSFCDTDMETFTDSSKSYFRENGKWRVLNGVLRLFQSMGEVSTDSLNWSSVTSDSPNVDLTYTLVGSQLSVTFSTGYGQSASTMTLHYQRRPAK